MEGHDSGFACWQATAIRNNETQFLLQGHLLDDPTDLVCPVLLDHPQNLNFITMVVRDAPYVLDTIL